MGLLMELGPCTLHEDDKGNITTKPNPHSWNDKANVFFLDEPIGVGYSYAEHGQVVGRAEAAALDVQAFVAIFIETFKEFKGRPLTLSGEVRFSILLSRPRAHTRRLTRRLPAAAQASRTAGATCPCSRRQSTTATRRSSRPAARPSTSSRSRSATASLTRTRWSAAVSRRTHAPAASASSSAHDD